MILNTKAGLPQGVSINYIIRKLQKIVCINCKLYTHFRSRGGNIDHDNKANHSSCNVQVENNMC